MTFRSKRFNDIKALRGHLMKAKLFTVSLLLCGLLFCVIQGYSSIASASPGEEITITDQKEYKNILVKEKLPFKFNTYTYLDSKNNRLVETPLKELDAYSEKYSFREIAEKMAAWLTKTYDVCSNAYIERGGASIKNRTSNCGVSYRYTCGSAACDETYWSFLVVAHPERKGNEIKQALFIVTMYVLVTDRNIVLDSVKSAGRDALHGQRGKKGTYNVGRVNGPQIVNFFKKILAERK